MRANFNHSFAFRIYYSNAFIDMKKLFFNVELLCFSNSYSLAVVSVLINKRLEKK